MTTRSLELLDEIERTEAALLDLQAHRAGLQSLLGLLNDRMHQTRRDIADAEVGIEAIRARMEELRREAVAIADAKRREAQD